MDRSFVLRGVFLTLLLGAAVAAYRVFDRGAPIPPRAIEGRVIGLAYGGRPNATRSNRFNAVQARAAIGTIYKSERGAEALLSGSATDAVHEIEDCTHADPGNDRCWSDLAAAYIEVGRAESDPRDFARALAAADRAVMIAPARVEALFNRAVALEFLMLAQPAAAAWRRYLLADADSAWASEARERKRALETPAVSGSWSDAIPRIERAAKIGDAQTIEEIVRTFPQDARAYGERRFTCDWEEALRNGDRARAADRLAMSRQTGTALRKVNGDELLSDAIDAIDRAHPSQIAEFMNAYRAYGQARALYAKRSSTEARPLFEQAAAAFRRLRSPMAGVVESYLAGSLSDLGENDAALDLIDRNLTEAPSSYIGLRAQLFWRKGVVQERFGLVFEATASFTAAVQIFDRQGERANASEVRSSLDALLGSMGREAEAWKLRVESFRDVSRLGDRRSLQASLMGAAGAEYALGRWDVAMSFYSVALESELGLPNPVQSADAAVRRALAAHKLELDPITARALTRARAQVAALSDSALRKSCGLRLRLAEAIIVRDRDPDQAVALLNEVIEDTTNRYRLPEAHLERGRARRAQQRYDEAIADFRETLDLVARREESMSTDEKRDNYFTTGHAAAEELTDLLDRLDRRDEALAVAERDRTRSFAPSSADAPETLHVPEGTLLAHYSALPDRLLIFLVSSDHTDVIRIPVTRAALEDRISRMRTAIADRDQRVIDTLGRELYDLLIARLGDRASTSQLVIVPDVTIAQVPFAALRTASGHFLLEEEESIIYAPSGGAFIWARERASSSEGTNVLAVGDPDFAQTLFPDLPRLPAARAEAREVAGLHPSSRLLIGPEATRVPVIEAMRTSRVIDIAAHAVVDRRDPSRSALLLASSSDDTGALHMSDIAHLTVPAEVVMLAGCNTSEIVKGTPPALRSFAFAFLAAGSRNVIGSLWPADDAAARVMSRQLHPRLRDGVPPALALRDAQLAMLRSSNPSFREPRAWSGYQLYGSGF